PDQFHVVGGYTFANDQNRHIWDADKSNWQPRGGAAYTLNDKTVLRGGFGIFMAPFQVETPQQVGFAGATAIIPTTNNGQTFIANLTNPIPSGAAGIQPSVGSGLGLLTALGADVAASDLPIIPVKRKNAKFARLVVGFQRELPMHF